MLTASCLLSVAFSRKGFLDHNKRAWVVLADGLRSVPTRDGEVSSANPQGQAGGLWAPWGREWSGMEDFGCSSV